MRIVRSAVVFVLAATVGRVAYTDDSLQRLESEFARLAESCGGMMGVGAIHLETGRSAYLNADVAFPMASAFKVPVAVQLLHKVDSGKLTLDKMLTVHPGDLSPGSGTLSRLFNDPGVVLSVRNLLELMLLISDNSATDMCLEQAGGGKDVTDRMNALGFEGIRVDRSTLQLIADYVGIEKVPSRRELNQDVLEGLFEGVTDDAEKEAVERFAKDPRDTSTPRDMAALLQAIWDGKALKTETTELLKDIMSRCETGDARLKGRLPEGTEVAHKTGTIGGTTNDVGVVTLPGDAGHVVVAAFVKDSSAPIEERERAIAEVARAAHDFFLFNSNE